jgi:hypothetical protein
MRVVELDEVLLVNGRYITWRELELTLDDDTADAVYQGLLEVQYFKDNDLEVRIKSNIICPPKVP